MNNTTLTFLIMLMCFSAKAQNDDSAGLSSNVELFSGMEALLERHQDFMKEKEIEGFKVQVYSGTTKEAAFKIRNELQNVTGGHDIKIGFERPYYRVRVGNFRDRFEAYKLARDLSEYFTRSAVYQDIIEPQKITIEEVLKEQQKEEAKKKYIAPK